MSEPAKISPASARLRAGVLRFQAEVHGPSAETYHRAATTPQKPDTLFITCSDSRIGVETLTSSGPGKIFIARNIGNLVPPYGQPLSDMAAVIEYAVSALKVHHVVICGHADCGAMKAILHRPATDALPAVRSWLQNAEQAPSGNASDALRTLTERNVLKQMEHLKTHPAVIDAMNERGLTVSGWVYEIGSGEVRIAEDGRREFAPVRREAEMAKGTVDA